MFGCDDGKKEVEGERARRVVSLSLGGERSIWIQRLNFQEQKAGVMRVSKVLRACLVEVSVDVDTVRGCLGS